MQGVSAARVIGTQHTVSTALEAMETSLPRKAVLGHLQHAQSAPHRPCERHALATVCTAAGAIDAPQLMRASRDRLSAPRASARSMPEPCASTARWAARAPPPALKATRRKPHHSYRQRPCAPPFLCRHAPARHSTTHTYQHRSRATAHPGGAAASRSSAACTVLWRTAWGPPGRASAAQVGRKGGWEGWRGECCARGCGVTTALVWAEVRQRP